MPDDTVTYIFIVKTSFIIYIYYYYVYFIVASLL